MIKKTSLFILLLSFLSCDNSNKSGSEIQSLEQLDKKGNYYLQSNQTDSAIIIYQKIIEVYPNKPNGYYGKGVAKAILCHKNNSCCEEAIFLLRKTTLINPKFKKAFFNMGVCYSSMGMYPESIHCFNKAIALDSTNGEYYCNRGFSKLLLNDSIDACIDFNKAKKLGAEKAKLFLQHCK